MGAWIVLWWWWWCCGCCYEGGNTGPIIYKELHLSRLSFHVLPVRGCLFREFYDCHKAPTTAASASASASASSLPLRCLCLCVLAFLLPGGAAVFHELDNSPSSSSSSLCFSPGFQNEFHGLRLPEDEQLWDLSPMSPTMTSWDAKLDPGFGNPNLERDLKNAHVRNGQPTPPPFDDRRASQGMYPPLPQYQLGAASPPAFPDRSQHRSLSEQSTFDEDPPYSPGVSSSSNTNMKRRKHRDSAVSKFSSISFGGSGRPERAKREKFLERNRLAASKCRQKKKEHTVQLESRYKEQSDKKELLVTEISRLRSEMLGLKNEVLRHAQCGDEPIKLHLAQMVKKITYTDTSTGAPELSDAADAVSTTPEDSPTPIAQQQRRQGQLQQQGTMSFGFDDALQMEPAAAASLEQQIRRESESSLASQGSYPFTSTDDSFDDLINV